jgi:uncharacterized protein (DUF1330 family)
MPAYAIAWMNITDAERFAAYSRQAAPALAKYGGRFLARGGLADMVEGNCPYTRLVVVEFESVEAAKQFYKSPDYLDARVNRIGAAEFNLVIIEGYSPVQTPPPE